MTRARAIGTIALLALLFAAFMGAGVVFQLAPARTPPMAGSFDAHAARERLARVLGDQVSHPVDSAAEDRTRAALLHEIEALGFQPSVRDAFACRPEPAGPLITCARVRNIVFSIGPAEGPSILAAAHYDSVPAGPGASDDGIGIAAWLEIAHALSRQRLTRRVIFLLSDGEEPGLLGAYEFVHHDPLMQSVQAIVNLEARGTRGPAIFFETSTPNADAINAYADVTRPVANSIMADAYRLLPNSTDVSVLSRPGLDVVNIALLDGLEDYHTPQDSLASFDLASLQHMGDAGLRVTRTLASAPDRGAGGNRVYTDIASYGFISMPSWLSQAVLALSALAAVGIFWRSGAQARWRTLGAPIGAVIGVGVLAFAVSFALGLVRPGEDYWFAHPEPTRAWCALLGLLALPLAAPIAGASASARHVLAAGMLWFAGLGLLLSLALPGISIFFTLPAVAYAVGALVGLAWKPALTSGAVVAGLIALLIWAPMLYLTELALGYEFPFVTAALVALACMPWLAAVQASWRSAGIVLASTALAAAALAAFTPASSPQRPCPLNILYFLNTSSGEARILAGSSRRALPPELAHALPFAPERMLPGDKQDYWAAPIAAQTMAAPTLTEISAQTDGAERVVSGRIRANGAYRVIVRLPRTARPLRVRVNGVESSFADAGADGDYVNIACQGRACDGAEVAVTVEESAPHEDWYVIGQFLGAPAIAQPIVAARPASATPIQFGDGVLTLSTLPAQ